MDYTKYLITEGWMKSGSQYSAWASDIDHAGRVRCPKCRKELTHKEIYSNPKHSGEEIANFEGKCSSCGAKLLIWND